MKGRQTSIEQYCKKRGLKIIPADPKAIAAYRESMEKLIPKIEREMREQAILVAKIRAENKPLF